MFDILAWRALEVISAVPVRPLTAAEALLVIVREQEGHTSLFHNIGFLTSRLGRLISMGVVEDDIRPYSVGAVIATLRDLQDDGLIKEVVGPTAIITDDGREAILAADQRTVARAVAIHRADGLLHV